MKKRLNLVDIEPIFFIAIRSKNIILQGEIKSKLAFISKLKGLFGFSFKQLMSFVVA
jgi:hypothetical protein